MKKILFLLICSMFIIAGCSGQEENSNAEGGNGEYVIRVPLLGSETNFVNRSYEEFKQNIEERTDGQIEVQIYGSGTLANAEEQQMELVDTGDAELTSIATGIITNHAGANSFGIFDVPFMFTDDEKLYNFLDSELATQLDEELEEKLNVKVIGNYDMKGYNVFNNVRPVEYPEDLNGLKIRSSPIDLQINLFSELGANPTTIAYGEAFTALQQGTIDGIHTATALGWTDKFYEASNYLTLTRHVALVHYIMLNEDFEQSLPEDLREILHEELDTLVETARTNGTETDQQALQEIEEAGVEITELTEEQFEAFRNASENTINDAIESAGTDFYNDVDALINE
ncbi:TRAP transporter substrate-binding protein [Oceanobacillus oncorhynchi]|uniref:TRAP transporter substrate-binding protein n=1 Tax=Oceanobacillus oncorhynchi TaxID=545501 RepID=UPI0034D685C7